MTGTPTTEAVGPDLPDHRLLAQVLTLVAAVYLVDTLSQAAVAALIRPIGEPGIDVVRLWLGQATPVLVAAALIGIATRLVPHGRARGWAMAFGLGAGLALLLTVAFLLLSLTTTPVALPQQIQGTAAGLAMALGLGAAWRALGPAEGPAR